MKGSGNAPDLRGEPGGLSSAEAAMPRSEPDANDGQSAQAMHGELLGRVLERENLQRALKRVRQNKGAPGIDGMSVDELPRYLKEHWVEIRAQFVAGSYRPQPVRRVEIDKPDGRKRMLGIPNVLDRFLQQATAQIVSTQWEPHFHDHSYGFRPQRRPTRPCVNYRPKSMPGAIGWLTSTWNLSLIESTMTDCCIDWRRMCLTWRCSS
jgi:hypothetical protein